MVSATAKLAQSCHTNWRVTQTQKMLWLKKWIGRLMEIKLNYGLQVPYSRRIIEVQHERTVATIARVVAKWWVSFNPVLTCTSFLQNASGDVKLQKGFPWRTTMGRTCVATLAIFTVSQMDYNGVFKKVKVTTLKLPPQHWQKIYGTLRTRERSRI